MASGPPRPPRSRPAEPGPGSGRSQPCPGGSWRRQAGLARPAVAGSGPASAPGTATAGSTSSNRLPTPTSLCTRTSPRWPRATDSTSARPRPVPPSSAALSSESPAAPAAGPVRNRPKMSASPACSIPAPPSAITIAADGTDGSHSRDSRIGLPATVCWTAFSSSASTASASRSRSACTVAGHSGPSCQSRAAVGCQRRNTSRRKMSSTTGSGRRKSGSSAAAISSSRRLSPRSRVSSPITTSMSRRSCPASSLAISSAWPSAIVIGVFSWCEASCRNRRWAASSRAFSWATRARSVSAARLRRACQTMAQNIAPISGTSFSSSIGSVCRQHVQADRRERGHADRGEHPERRPGPPDPEPVQQRDADPDEVERDRLPPLEDDDRDQVRRREHAPGQVDPARPERPPVAGPQQDRSLGTATRPGKAVRKWRADIPHRAPS